jgi:hypothetical protein
MSSNAAAPQETLRDFAEEEGIDSSHIRRNLGRRARKRRKKYQEIVAASSSAAAAATAAGDRPSVAITTSKTGQSTSSGATNTRSADNNTSNNNHNNSAGAILPTDRGYVWDAVRDLSNLSQDDEQDLVRQLGYLPGNALQVVARVGDIFPADCFAPRITTNTSGGGEKDNGIMNRLMREPLVLKLYPLVMRDETTGTRSRRKRKGGESSSSTTTTTTTKEVGRPSGRADALDSNQKNTRTHESSSPSSTSSIIVTPPVYHHQQQGECVGADVNHPLTGEAAQESLRLLQHQQHQQQHLLEPFPTIFWVTHPLIKAEISKLELERVGSEFEQRLVMADAEATTAAATPTTTPGGEEQLDGPNRRSTTTTDAASDDGGDNVAQLMRLAHASYGAERSSLLTSKDWEGVIRPRKWEEAFSSTGRGVAGIRNPLSVKCLHAHAAHFWSGCDDNVVGRWVSERLIVRMKDVRDHRTSR